MMCVVQKEFVGAGESYVRNQLVDGSQFRNESVLITTRYLRPATQDEVASARFEDESEPVKLTAKRATGGLKARKVKRH